MSTPQETKSDAGLASAMRISVTRLARRLRAERQSEGLEPDLSDTQLAALAALERHSAMTPGELADHEKVQPPSMTRIVAALEGIGYVARLSDPTDRRVARVQVTESGRAVLRRGRSRKDAFLAGQLHRLDPAEREELAGLTALLERLVEGGEP